MKRLILFFCCILYITQVAALRQPREIKSQVDSLLSGYERVYAGLGRFRAKEITINPTEKRVNIYCSEAFSYIPYRPALVTKLYSQLDSLTHPGQPDYKVVIYAGNKEISSLIPNMFRPEKQVDKSRLPKKEFQGVPLLLPLSKPYTVSAGLQNRHLALWQSHGLYYNIRTDRWLWQRERVFQTVEDKYTMSYILPYLMPMLENAGATVFLPRERDTQTNEVIVDNNGSTGKSIYRERGGAIETGGNSGFGFTKKQLENTDNPFVLGTYRKASARANENTLFEWLPDIPDDGWYYVSVAYKTLPNSTQNAHYTVYHTGGQTEFSVNQQMGGSTWIYLGRFFFKKGIHSEAGRVTLSGASRNRASMLTADAVRFGGGMGNIARPDFTYEKIPAKPTVPTAKPDTLEQEMPDETRANARAQQENGVPQDSVRTDTILYIAKHVSLSGRPRYLEGARYWLQWAGMPTQVYHKRIDGSPNDYNEDIWARPYWVNYLNGGSVYSGKDSASTGLKIPIDLSMAIHSDAGRVRGDSIVGTLAIYTTLLNNGLFSTGQSRMTSRDLSDMIQTQIVDDLRQGGVKNWTRRGLWDRSYAESRETDVPSVLMELLSHENFADMKYGLDPRFKFTVSRSIYKAILKYISFQHHTPFVVQPLPASQLASEFVDETHIKLSWKAEIDSLEPTAIPNRYIVYSRVEGEGFDNGQITTDTSMTLAVEKGKIYSFRVSAVNEGGESMPSEILSVCRNWNNAPVAMIINGFDRVSAPTWFDTPSYGGFTDNGVPDKADISFTGKQNNFNRLNYKGQESASFGNSDANYENTIVAGNSFDLPFVHGQALKAAGYSFVSCSRSAIEANGLGSGNYKMVDLILGKEKQVGFGTATNRLAFKTFSEKLNDALYNYFKTGGNLFVSGCFVGSDLWNNGQADSLGIKFVTSVLKYKWHNEKASVSGQVQGSATTFPMFEGKWSFCTQLNDKQYAAESVDGIDPIGNAHTIALYPESNTSAAVAYKGAYRTVVCGFPFESLSTEAQRKEWMQKAIRFFEK
jgi:hypothetical protein